MKLGYVFDSRILAARTGSLRWGLASVLFFFLAGGLLAVTVDERGGMRRAQEAGATGGTAA